MKGVLKHEADTGSPASGSMHTRQQQQCQTAVADKKAIITVISVREQSELEEAGVKEFINLASKGTSL